MRVWFQDYSHEIRMKVPTDLKSLLESIVSLLSCVLLGVCCVNNAEEGRKGGREVKEGGEGGRKGGREGGREGWMDGGREGER